jgi:hypothetical protein
MVNPWVFPNEQEYIYWLFENGLKESTIENIHFYDKGYAFFRSFMDIVGDYGDLIAIVKYMVNNNINYSRDLNVEEHLTTLRELNIGDRSIEFIEKKRDMIYIPDVFEYLRGKSNIVLCGGGRNECLYEIEIILMSQEADYELLQKFVY